jgi:hypothetical protein
VAAAVLRADASGTTCRRRLTEWHEADVWQELRERLLAVLRAAGLLELSVALVDPTHLRALKRGTTPGRVRSTDASLAPSTT